MSTKVFIDGESGTTGLQIRDRLTGRTDIELLVIDSKHRKNPDARRVLLNSADIAILCLPDVAAKEAVSLIENESTAVIDASTAHRIDPEWVYGFAEMAPNQANVIAQSKRVTNPGCYPQGVIALLKPLIEGNLLPKTSELTIDAVSGYSGGGRKMIEEYEECGEGNSPYLPYGLTFDHKHLPEMTHYSGLTKSPLFIPSVGNFFQGMMVKIPLHFSVFSEDVTGERIQNALEEFYVKQKFVEVAPLEATGKVEEISPKCLNGTNLMRLHVFANDSKGQLLLVAVYDNLGKGASGSAVQNLNLMLNCNESESLLTKAA